MLTADRARELLQYDPKTGALSWRVSRGNRRAGSPVASLNGEGYVQITIDGQNYRAHRVAWLIVYGEWPSAELDHKNRVRNDNRLSELRPATRAQNSANTSRRADNTSGYRGVYLDKRDGRWSARITVNGKDVCLGRYATAAAAASVFNEAAHKLRGEFVCL